MSVLPHGGILVNRELTGSERTKALLNASSLKELIIPKRLISDLEMIGTGVFSPLTGFMKYQDYMSVLLNSRLTDHTIWSIPITLPVKKEEKNHFQVGDTISLKGEDGIIYGTLCLKEIYVADKQLEAEKVYGTTDLQHPGVKKLFELGDVYLAGPIFLLNRQDYSEYYRYYMTPIETRQMFTNLQWNTIVGFQTRNPVHRAHEYIQKSALEIVDGLFLNPLIGETKEDDLPANVRMKSYEVLLQHYFPKNRARLVVYPASMRYAGPREAVLHAITRKNYGCTHFIIGRDHAGVGNFYGSYESQEYISQFEKELGIQILKFDHAFYCKKCGNTATKKTCPHDNTCHIHLSGTNVRQKLRNGEKLPQEFSRPEVSEVLIRGMQSEKLEETGE